MVIDVWRAVRWWDEWQLRILVLLSLFVQWFLLVAAPMRKYTVPQWFRTLIWFAYVSCDALAIYALATLFNRHAKGIGGNGGGCGGNGGNACVLEIMWAPVLLIHMGGQRELTAYTIEDNELWIRHTVTLVSQVAVAVYAFYKSWPDSADRRLYTSAVVLFVVGVLSFCEKPWAFRRARIHRLAAASSLIQGTKQVRKWEFCFTELEEDVYMSKMERVFWCCSSEEGRKAYEPAFSIKNQVHMILSDMSLFAAESDLKKRGRPEERILVPAYGAESFSKRWLRKAFGLIYTRANVVWTPAYLAYHLLLVPALHVAAITLFAVSHKRGVYYPADVKTTYVLLSFTAALDFVGVFIGALLHKLMANVPSLCEWIAQYNLIDAVLRRRRRSTGWVFKCASRFDIQLEDYFVFKSKKLYSKVAGYLIVDWFRRNKTVGLDLSSYRNLAINLTEEPDEQKKKHGNWALGDLLKSHPSVFDPKTEVWASLMASFDRSVLTWHIATDLCFCLRPPPAPMSPREVRTEAISNYMSHLLNFRPDMLLTGSRRHLFVEAMDDIDAILNKELEPEGRHFKETPKPNDKFGNDKQLVECIFRQTLETHGCRKLTCDSSMGSPSYPLIHDASRLAQELLTLDEEIRLEVMYRVWLGMLFYSATMCRGYLHAKSLGEGGEFLSFIWLLLSTTGSKTLADKLQMPDQLHHQDDDDAGHDDRHTYMFSIPRPDYDDSISDLRMQLA